MLLYIYIILYTVDMDFKGLFYQANVYTVGLGVSATTLHFEKFMILSVYGAPCMLIVCV